MERAGEAKEETTSAQAKRARSPLARLSFWCGIAAWGAALLAPILLIYAFFLVYPLASLAVGIGVVALLHIRRSPTAWTGKGQAITGIIMGGIWILFLTIALVLNSR